MPTSKPERKPTEFTGLDSNRNTCAIGRRLEDGRWSVRLPGAGVYEHIVDDIVAAEEIAKRWGAMVIEEGFTGEKEPLYCRECFGIGRVMPSPPAPHPAPLYSETCKACNGTGIVPTE